MANDSDRLNDLAKEPSHSIGQSPGRIAPWLATAITGRTADVPCGECRRCCTHPNLHADLQEDELPRFPSAVPDHLVEGGWRLPKKPNGECVHLVGRQCSIYERRPRSCRAFDCRVHLFRLQPINGVTADLVQSIYSMWEGWVVDTPADVDSMMAITRAVAEAIRQEARQKITNQFRLTANIKTLYSRYVFEAAKERERIGFEAARTLAMQNDRNLRAGLMHVLQSTNWVLSPPALAPKQAELTSISEEVERIARSITAIM